MAGLLSGSVDSTLVRLEAAGEPGSSVALRLPPKRGNIMVSIASHHFSARSIENTNSLSSLVMLTAWLAQVGGCDDGDGFSEDVVVAS